MLELPFLGVKVHQSSSGDVKLACQACKLTVNYGRSSGDTKKKLNDSGKDGLNKVAISNNVISYFGSPKECHMNLPRSNSRRRPLPSIALKGR